MDDVCDLINQLGVELTGAPRVIPLQRRIRNSNALFVVILERGYPVKALAVALASRGVVTRGGQPISYGHLRVLLTRLTLPTKTTRRSTPKPEHRPTGRAVAKLPPRQPSRQRPDFSGGLFGGLFDQKEKAKD